MANEPNTTPGARHAQAIHRLAVGTAWVAAVFSAIVVGLLVTRYIQRPETSDPAETPAYQELKLQAKADPANEELAEQIRAMDLKLRRQYFDARQFAARGAGLALVGLIVFLGAMLVAKEMKQKIPCPEPETSKHDVDEAIHASGRLGVGLLAAILFGVMIGASLYSYSEVALLEATWQSEQTAEADAATSVDGPDAPAPPMDAVGAAPTGTPNPFGPPATGANDTTFPQASDQAGDGGGITDFPSAPQLPPPPTREEIERNWPTFRGPDGSGHSRYTNIPTSWDGTTGQGILWKTPIPLPGNNSPVVWGDRVFLSGADETTRAVYCVDADTGQIVWTRELPWPAESELPRVSADTGYAAPTMATDGRLAFAIFANCEIFALDYDGNVLWSRAFGEPDNVYGYSSSLALFEDTVIVQNDQGGRDDGLSKLIGLDAGTGQTRWETPRVSDNSWSSPIVAPIAGAPQIITAGCPYAAGYDARTGEELWYAEATDGDMGPSPVTLGDMAFTATYYLQLSAIDATGSGDVTESHIRWTADRGLSETSSPLVTEKYVFVVEDSGYVTCYDVATGDMLWELETDAFGMYASPGLAGGLVYLFSPEGDVYLFEATDSEGKVVGQCPLGEACVTSPAFQEGRLYIRGEENLLCIGE